MSTHRAKHALIVGLGQQAKGYLDALKPDDGDATMRTLWLADDANAAWNLYLDKGDLRHLYYEDESVRAWSSANWWGWQDADGLSKKLRLSGKLALYHHHQALDTYLLDQINALYHGKNVRLAVYLIAALYEPFASGALFDTAYMLHKLARERKGRLFTILLLPGIVSETAPTPEERQLQGATTYATLRELGFLLGYPSFYQPHPKLRIKHSGLIHNRSPFQSGDVFLIGGESVGDGEGGFRALQEHDAQQSVSAFVKLHYNTHLGDYLPHAQRGNGCVSTFGIVSQSATQQVQQEQTEQAQQNQCNAQKKQVYQALLHVTRADTDALPEVMRAIDQAREKQDGENEQNRDHQTQNTAESLHDAFTRELERPQRSLAELLALAERQSKAVEAAYKKTQGELDELPKGLPSTARTVESGKASRATLIVYLLPIWISGLLLFLTLGWFVGFLAWFVLGLSPAWMGYSFEQSVYQRGDRQTEERKNQSIKTENRKTHLTQALEKLAALQTLADETFRLKLLESAVGVVSEALADVQKAEEAAQKAEEESAAPPDTATPQLLDDKALNAVKQTMLNSLSQDALDATQLDALLTEALQESGKSRSTTEYKDLPQLKQQALTLVGLDSSKIGATQEHPVAILEVNHDDSAHQCGIPQTDMDAQTSAKLISTIYRLKASEPQRHFVRVRTDIPLSALMNITDWHKAYQEVIEHTVQHERFLRHTWLHPTRDGIAASDILALGNPLSAMIYVALLHRTESTSKSTIVEQLAKDLHVPRSTKNTHSYDELCGSLQESPEMLVAFINKVFIKEDALQRADIDTQLQLLKEELHKQRPHPSEHYAAWEVWVYDLIAHDFEVLGKRNETFRSEMQRLVAALYHHFTEHNQQVRQ